MRTLLLLAAVLACFDNSLRAADPPAVVTRDGRVLAFDPDWTPRPQEGDKPAYVKETDVDWVDDRLRRMDTGRTFNATFKYRHGGNDVTGALRAIESITTGLGWRRTADPVTVTGEPGKADLEACWELGATVAAGLTD